ncbi:MAG: riboflavin biosynthesis protein RibF [Alphaproteobacteria bacterium]
MRVVIWRLFAAGGIVVVFEPHPRQYFQPEKPFFHLTTMDRKLELLAEYGMALTVVLPFDAEFARLTAEEFVRDVLVEGLGIRHATTGYNFFFGNGREGNPDVLRSLGNKYDFGVTIVEAVGSSGEIFSSTRVRELLAEGDVAAAADMLGRFWQKKGVVETGAGRGAGLGFPTANIRLQRNIALGHGIYAVRVTTADGKRYNAAAYLGTRPTFDAGAPLLESFLLDFEGNLYGQEITVEFVDYIRADAKFKSISDLTKQIKVDCTKAREILAALE